MYKNYSCLVFILFLFYLNIVKAQTTYVPDNNFEQALIDLGYDDVLDDYVHTVNISNIVELNISNKNRNDSSILIRDLTGIQDFENLQFLNCKNNFIRNLDMSQNKQLKYLYCHYNAIQSINISGNPELEILNCRNNTIGDLNVDKNTKLKVLNCIQNNLHSLNLSQNSALTTLYCANNNIYILDLSKNKQLEIINCNRNNRMLSLNVNNGANSLITDFHAILTFDLECIIVDNAETANAGLSPYDNWEKHSTTSYCENPGKTFVPDDNFEQALIDLGYDNVLDDYVLTSNISNVINLNVSNKYISDLTGIEDFKSIRFLKCERNQITSLNVNRNTGLKDLYCYDNRLTSLDVSKNNALTALLCANNQLTSLDVSQNTALGFLNCAENQLTSLDVSQNTALTTLICSNNPIKILDVSKNTVVNYLHCINNQLTSLDVSQNTALTTLVCYDNQLTSLDVKNGANTKLTALWAHKNVNLTCIQVDNADDAIAGVAPYNNWNIDASATYSEDCSNIKTYIPDDNFEQALIDLGHDDVLDDYVLTSNISGIEKIEITNRGIADLTGIEAFTSLKELWCAVNSLVNLSLTENKNLTTLYCHQNQLTSLDLTQNTELDELNFFGNRITSMDLTQNIRLDHLNCHENQLIDLDLSKNVILRELQCSRNPQLTSINLKSGNNTYLSDLWVQNNPALTCIEVDDEDWANSQNSWHIDDHTKFANDCNYGKTRIPDDNFEQALIDQGYDDVLDDYVLTSNIYGVKKLYISDKNINDLTGIQDFKSLRSLRCYDNNLSTLDIGKNIELRYVKCHENQLTNLDLSKNKALLSLSCRDNQITTLDLSQNPALTVLNCARNKLVSLDVKNGSNSVLTTFVATGNPDLSCIEVDKPNDANAGIPPYNTWTKDNTTTYCTDEDRTYIPDDAFEGYLITEGYDDVLDNYVLTANINTITSLFFCNADPEGSDECEAWYYGIQDLTGIEDFESLVYFGIRFGGNINLSIDFSGNPNLETVNLDEGDVGSLNLSNNFKLKFLNIVWSSGMRELDLSNNVNLRTLYIEELTQLQKINLNNKNNTSLTTFYSIDNSNLSCIQVDNVAWSTANWTDVDPWTSFSEDCENTGLTNVPDDNFEQALIDLGLDDVLDDSVLTANITGVKELDVSNRNISNLSGIQDFKSLRSLICNDNQLTGLDPTRNIELRNLRCHKNKITTLDLTKNIALRYLSCRNNQIQDLDVSQNSELTILRCSNNKLTSLDVRNGGNAILTTFSSLNNPDLACIEVDNAMDANTGISPYEFWLKDVVATYSEDCSYPAQSKTTLNIEKEVLSEIISLYPNPVSGILNIDSGSLSLIKIEIYSILGQKLKEISADLNTIEISDLMDGIYLIRLYTRKGIIMRKIIKK